MIVTVRRWTSVALPRLWAGRKARTSKVSGQKKEPTKRIGFLEQFSNMFEHQVNLAFKDEYPK